MGAIDKLFVPIAGKPSIAWVLAALAGVPEIEQIIVPTSPANREALTAVVSEAGLQARGEVCLGGQSRQESVARGVERLHPRLELIVIHDAARPLVSADLIWRGIAAGAETGAAIAALPVSDTIKLVGPDGVVIETPERDRLYAVQTPQVFRRDWLLDAYNRAGEAEVTDEAGLLERAGYPVHVFPGSPENLKLTRPVDLRLAELLLADRVEERQ